MSVNTVLLLPHQERFVQSPNLFPDIRWHFLLGGYGCGKMEWVEQTIPTPEGPRRFGDLKVGDIVFAANGKPTKVTGVFPKGRQDAYKITFSDGRSDICGEEHLWGVYYYSHSGFKYKVIELGEMLSKGVRRPDARYTKAGGKPRYWIPASPVCYYPDKELPVDPYALGSLIGNGCLTLPYLTISSNDEWQVAKVATRLKADYKKRTSSYSWVLYHDGHMIKTQDAVPKSLCCLAGEKYIPDSYKVAGVEQRKELLQGLFDTDGSVDNSGNRLHVTYTTVSQRLAEDIREVLLSLGIVSTIRVDRREGRNDCYVLLVNCAQEQKAWLFSLPRKLERVTSFKRADKRDYSRVAVYSIEKLPQQLEMQCIMVDDPAHLYLTNEHIVTHNTRSLAISALKIIEELDGDKDEGGLYAKVIVAGYTYAHLEQTFLIDFRAYLDNSKTPYHEDTKNHIFTVGTVQVVLVQLLEPGKIFGQSVYCALCVDGDAKVWVRGINGEVEEVQLKQIAPGDNILTRYGWKKVTAKKCSGYRPCIKTNGVYTTLNHPFKVWDTKKHKEVIRKANELNERYMVIHSDEKLSSVLQDRTLIEKEVWDITVEDVHEFMVGVDRASAFVCKNCDEVDELPEDVMIEAMKSVSQRVRQIMPEHRSPYIMSASTAQGMKGFYRLYCHYKKSGIGFVLTRARTQDNWYLPKEYILDLWKNFTPTERKVYMEGAFLSVTQGRVIPGFDWDRNFIPEDDDFTIMPGDRVYWGQDFNCGVGETLVITSRGEVQLKDIKVGDYVLTRKGFKKVLTAACRGVKIVYDFGKLGFTKDHVAITPQGDKQLWEAQNFYCLKEQSISEYGKLGTMWETLNELKQCFMTGTCGEGILTASTTHSENTLQATGQCCTGTFIKSFMEKYLKGITSTTRIDTMITDLKLLSVCQAQNMRNFIMICQETISENLHGKTQQKRYSLGISQKKVKRIIQRYLKKLGLQERSTVNVLASIVAEYFRLKSERLNVALSAGLSTVSREKLTAIDVVRSEITETLMLLLRELVLFVERRLQELLQRNTAKNISVIGSVPATNEREAEVYDIEVEDAHEFFANGILVHNCGYNRGSIWVARGGVLHCVKYYDFPDPGDSPDVVRYDFPEQDIFWLPDVTIKDQYPHYARALRKNDIHIIHRSKSPLVEDSCFLISKLCLQGRIIIHNGAREVAEAFSTASRDKDNKIPKGVGPNSPIHAIDGARYVCSYLALVLPEFRDLRRGIMSHLASFRAGAEEMETRFTSDLGAGYHRYEGADFKAE